MPVCARRNVIAAGVAALILVACGQPSHEPNWAATNDGVIAYMGVSPSAVVRTEHPASSAGAAHIVVALYDAASGARIETASVEARIRGERHRAERRIRLDPMRINDTVTYGGFVSFADNDRYHINLMVLLPGSRRETRLQFLFDARGLPHAGR